MLLVACVAGAGDVAGLAPAAGSPSSPRLAPRAAITGTLTIVDHTSYSNVSTVSRDTDQTACTLTITFHGASAATERLTYTAHDVSDQTNNGYEDKTTTDVQGSGTVSYDPGLNVAISQDGTFQLSANDEDIQARETSTQQTTGQQASTQTTTQQVDCTSGHPPGLSGKIGSGPCLRATVTDRGHFGFTSLEVGTSTTILACLAVPNLHFGRRTLPAPTPTATGTTRLRHAETPTATAQVTATPTGTARPRRAATATATTTAATLNRGSIQIQGDDIKGMPGAVRDTLSWFWAQRAPLCARMGRQQLARLWGLLSPQQQHRRDQAYYAAVRYITAGPPSGHRPPGQSFQNSPGQRGGVANARVDVAISAGVAFNCP